MATREQLMKIVEMARANPDILNQAEAPDAGLVQAQERKAGLVGGLLRSPKASNVQKLAVDEQLRMAKQEEELAKARTTGVEPIGTTVSGAGETSYDIPKSAERKVQELEDEVAKKRALGKVDVEHGVEKKQAEDIRMARQDLTNARLKIGNAFDSWLSVVDRTQRLTDVGPGIVGGAITEVLGKTKANEFVNAFKGGLVEYAAAVGRVAIPGARATRLINLFKTTAPTTFDTVPSAIEQSALSFRNGLATDISRHPEEYLPGFTGTNEQFLEVDKMLKDFQNQYREGLYQQAFDKNPELLPPDIRARFQAEAEGQLIPGTGDDDINALLDRMGAD